MNALDFFTAAQDSEMPVSVYLNSGVLLTGKIVYFKIYKGNDFPLYFVMTNNANGVVYVNMNSVATFSNTIRVKKLNHNRGEYN